MVLDLGGVIADMHRSGSTIPDLRLFFFSHCIYVAGA